jgi:hypothetical protein
VTPGSLIFMHRMAQMVAVETSETLMDDDHADSAEEGSASDPDFLVYRIAGPFFFGAVNSVAAALDQIGERPKIFVLDLAKVPSRTPPPPTPCTASSTGSRSTACGSFSAAPRAACAGPWWRMASTAGWCISAPTRPTPALTPPAARERTARPDPLNDRAF